MSAGAVPGDRADDGFDAFFRTDHPGVVALALALTGSREVATDLSCEAMSRALREWDVVRAAPSPGGWVRRVVIDLADEWWRSGRAGDSIDTADPEADRFWVAVRSLPASQRSAITLHYLEDRSAAEIAAMLDAVVPVVEASLVDARATLAAALGVDDTSIGLRQDRGDDVSEWAP